MRVEFSEKNQSFGMGVRINPGAMEELKKFSSQELQNWVMKIDKVSEAQGVDVFVKPLYENYHYKSSNIPRVYMDLMTKNFIGGSKKTKCFMKSIGEKTKNNGKFCGNKSLIHEIKKLSKAAGIKPKKQVPTIKNEEPFTLDKYNKVEAFNSLFSKYFW